jgi:hypothetical protein
LFSFLTQVFFLIEQKYGNTTKEQGKIWYIFLFTYPPVKIEPRECSETSAFNIQRPGKYPEENLPYLQHGESLKANGKIYSLPTLLIVLVA